MLHRRVSIVAAVAAAVVAATSDLTAEPYLALRTGLRCAQCHVNRTGGGGRSDFGSAWAQTQLPATSADIRARSLNGWVSIGLDLRARATSTLRRGPAVTAPRTAVDMPETQLQVEARLIANRLAFYVDESLGPERAYAREAFALLEQLPARGYVKAGKFLLPYGWRLWDDEAFIRSQTGFTYLTPDVGLEVGADAGPLSWSLAVTNGAAGATEGNDGKMVTSSAQYVAARGRVGASVSRNTLPASERTVVGGFGGFRAGPVAVLGEADWIRESLGAQPDRAEFAAYGEVNWLARRGVNAKVTYGYHDPNLDIAEDQRIRLRAGVEWFPVPFVQVGTFVVRFDGAGPPNDVDRVDLEVHLHF